MRSPALRDLGKLCVAVYPLLYAVATRISVMGISGDLGLGITVFVMGSTMRSKASKTICPMRALSS